MSPLHVFHETVVSDEESIPRRDDVKLAMNQGLAVRALVVDLGGALTGRYSFILSLRNTDPGMATQKRF